jgi:hypothetical protein
MRWFIVVATAVVCGAGACFNEAVGAGDIIACTAHEDCPTGQLCDVGRCFNEDVVNNPPAPADVLVTLNEDDVVQVDMRPPVNDIEVRLTTLPLNGVATLLDGIVTYQPQTNYVGSDSIEVHWQQGQKDLGLAVVTMRVLPINDLPRVRLVDANRDEIDQLSPNEAGEVAFFVEVADADVPGLLRFGEGAATYDLAIIAEVPDCPYVLENLIADAWKITVPDDNTAACQGDLPAEFVVTMIDDSGDVGGQRSYVLNRTNINDAPTLDVVVRCVGQETIDGRCRGVAEVEASARDDDGDVICVTTTAVDQAGTHQRVDGDACGALATVVPTTGVQNATIDVVACDDSAACARFTMPFRFVTTTRDCATLLNENPGAPSGVYEVDPLADGVGHLAYCDMEHDQGGFALVMKIDGERPEYSYGDASWTDNNFEVETQLDLLAVQSKHRAYATMPLTQVLLVMKDPLIDDVVFDAQQSVRVDAFAATSFRALVTGGAQRAGDDAERWRFVDNTHMQCLCNQVVVNTRSLRFGFLADDTPDCANPDGYVGIGGGACFDSSTAAAGNCAGGNPRRQLCEQEDGTNDTYRPRFAWVFVRNNDFSDGPVAASCSEHAARGRSIDGRYRLADGSVVDCTF